MFLPRPLSLAFAKSWLMKFFSVNPRCWKTPVSRYCAKTTSSGVRAAAEPTLIPSSPADTCPGHISTYFWEYLDMKDMAYHVKAQPTLSLRLKHDHVHDAHYGQT